MNYPIIRLKNYLVILIRTTSAIANQKLIKIYEIFNILTADLSKQMQNTPAFKKKIFKIIDYNIQATINVQCNLRMKFP